MSILLLKNINKSAEYMLDGAVCNFEYEPQLMKNFFRTGKDHPGIALTAYHNQLRDMKKFYPSNERARVIPNLNKHIKADSEVKQTADEYVSQINKSYPKSARARMALAYYGAVRSDDVLAINEAGKSLETLHKATRLEKFKAALDVSYHELKEILFPTNELKQLKKSILKFLK